VNGGGEGFKLEKNFSYFSGRFSIQGVQGEYVVSAEETFDRKILLKCLAVGCGSRKGD